MTEELEDIYEMIEYDELLESITFDDELLLEYGGGLASATAGYTMPGAGAKGMYRPAAETLTSAVDPSLIIPPDPVGIFSILKGSALAGIGGAFAAKAIGKLFVVISKMLQKSMAKDELYGLEVDAEDEYKKVKGKLASKLTEKFPTKKHEWAEILDKVGEKISGKMGRATFALSGVIIYMIVTGDWRDLFSHVAKGADIMRMLWNGFKFKFN